MLIVLGVACLGAFLAVGYTLGRTSDSYRQAVALIRDTPIDETNPAERRARAEAIGRQQGLRLGACMVAAVIGAIVGSLLGLVAWALSA
jgi:hypothetical protein